MSKKLVRIVFVLLIIYISYNNYLNLAARMVLTNKIDKIKENQLKTIQYRVVTESFSLSQGKFIKKQDIYYIYPYKLRIDTISENKTVEIYNVEKHYYYDDITNKVRVKEAFPPKEPYVLEIMKKVSDVLNSGKYEFFGYEERDNLKIEVLGIKNKIDGNSYMHKIWIADINGKILPIREEYFINGQVVEKSEYTYEKINLTIDNNVFEPSSLSASEIIDDGYLAKHIDTIEEAKKYLDFTPKLPIDIIPSYISVTPPSKNPSLTLVYINNNKRIILNEWRGKLDFIPNAKFGNINAVEILDVDKVTIKWNQDGIVFEILSDKENINELINLAEMITKEKYVKEEMQNE
ncbi:MAG: hypothetical protein N2594_02645 [Clostridiales bacterium]|nr:hypothetical protein [Clostridiales bacterium]